MHYAPALRALFAAKVRRRCPALLLDLSQVEFIDSTGIAVIIEYLRDTSEFGGQFCIGGLSDAVRYIFGIIHLDRALPIFDELGKATAAFSNGAIPPAAEPLFGEARQHPAAAAA